MSQPEIIELEFPICHSASERPGTEVLDVERVGPNRYRLVYSPGVVEGLAGGDEFEPCPTDPKGFNVLKRSRYLCVWFYFEEPGVNRGPDGNAVRAAVERFGELCDGGGNTHLVFSVPVSLGFPAVKALFNDLAGRYPGSSWLFGNVYNPWNDFKPLGWWEQESYGEQGMDLKELETIARRELAKNGLRGWSFGLSKAKRRLGVCKYEAKRIEIAEYYARNSPEESVLDTLLHEIAHAIAGPAAKHGPKWKAVAIRRGATPRSCGSSGQAVVEPGDWQATCPACGKSAHLYRQPRSLTGYRCTCEARSPLMFEYVGDPARKPVVPLTPQESARWEAMCSGCGTVHLRVRRPRANRWRCKCPRCCEIVWRPRSG